MASTDDADAAQIRPRPNRRTPLDPERLRRKRAEAGLTQLDLARRVGTWASHIHRLENGSNGASPRMLGRLAEALGCAVNDLMFPFEGEVRSA